MAKRRRAKLLRLAAKSLDDGMSPFAAGFLLNNSVSLDECFDLSEDLASAARLYAQTIDDLSSKSSLIRTVAVHRLLETAEVPENV